MWSFAVLSYIFTIMGDLFSYSAPNNICYKKKGFFFLGAVDFNDVRQQPDTQGRMILPLTDWPEFASWWLLCFRVSVLQKEKKKKKKRCWTHRCRTSDDAVDHSPCPCFYLAAVWPGNLKVLYQHPHHRSVTPISVNTLAAEADSHTSTPPRPI